jgi:mannan endo-1,4-beta-mannosidase
MRLIGIAVAMALLATAFSTPWPAAATTGFVTRSGTSLTLDGQAFRFTGLNIYNANSNGLCWYPMDGSVLDQSLVAIGPGKPVFRAWFFQQLATTNGARDWIAFDRTIATAKSRGMRIIATLIDQWGNCGSVNPTGGYKNKAWYTSGYKQPDPVGIVAYRDWAAEVATRYRDEPTILAWQLVNEAEVKPSADSATCSVNAATILKNFAADVSARIKAADPNHLVSLGTIGTGQCGAQGSEYQDVHSVATIDLCEYHDYDPLHAMPGDRFNGLQIRINQCRALGKPIFVGETGIRPSDLGSIATLATRADEFRSKFDTQFGAGVVGELIWAWDEDGSRLDNYNVGPNDPVLDVLARYRAFSIQRVLLAG